jgi:hypothetical protein
MSSVDAPAYARVSALHVALMRQNNAVAMALIDAGADVSSVRAANVTIVLAYTHYTALHYAREPYTSLHYTALLRDDALMMVTTLPTI